MAVKCRWCKKDPRDCEVFELPRCELIPGYRNEDDPPPQPRAVYSIVAKQDDGAFLSHYRATITPARGLRLLRAGFPVADLSLGTRMLWEDLREIEL